MKKLSIILLLLFLSTNVASAKEQKTIEETILHKCDTQISNYKTNNSIDNAINLSECIYRCQKKYKLNIATETNNLYNLYTTKFYSSANNPLYFNKMYQYAFETIKAGNKDLSVIKNAIFLAQNKECNTPYLINKNLSNLDFAFELLYQESPREAETIKASVIKTKENLLKKKQAMYNQTAEYFKSDEFKDMADGPTWDPLTDRFVKPSEIKARNNALLKQGTSFEQQMIQKKQNKILQNTLQEINNSLQSINFNLNGIR